MHTASLVELALRTVIPTLAAYTVRTYINLTIGVITVTSIQHTVATTRH